MKIKIYRGTKEIGGTCVEITADNGKILWIDLGVPLSTTNPDTSYRNNKVDALLISHPHQDHFGLMESVGSEVPVYIGQVSEDLIKATKRFLGIDPPLCNFQRLTPWKEIKILDTFKVYSYLVDHSSPEGLAFLIEVDGKRVFYSGDFRSTGRKGFLYDRMISNPPKNINLLLIEGTMVERSKQEYETEAEVERAITDIVMNQQNMTFVVSAAQNIDRFCSVFTACLKANKMLIIDVYTAFVLELVSKMSNRLPTIDAHRILVYNPKSQMDKVTEEEFVDFVTRVNTKALHNGVFVKPEKFVYFLRFPQKKFVNALFTTNKNNVNLIYSQWGGYLKERYKVPSTDTINKLKVQKNINFSHIHTSGHAPVEELIELAKAISPEKIVPIHTENPTKMKLEFAAAGLANVELWDDGLEYSL
ncbi:MAG: MBL fold metallo-hydrolase [Bacteroidetes bacterium]|nr:MBL fold metallo-hydrolase [Bacteroidota bacterium]